MSAQYNAVLTKIGTVTGSSREQPHHDLGSETLQQKGWYKKCCCFHKILKLRFPGYLYKIFPIPESSYEAEKTERLQFLMQNLILFKILFSSQQLNGMN